MKNDISIGVLSVLGLSGICTGIFLLAGLGWCVFSAGMAFLVLAILIARQ